MDEKIAAWNFEGSEAPPDQYPIDDPPTDSNFPPLIDYAAALKFLVDSRQFKKLQSRIYTSFVLTPREGTVIDAINRHIRAGLTQSSTCNEARFEIEWDPVMFWKEQEYQDTPYRNLGKVITLIGGEIDAQATTVAQYMQQTWPITGIETLKAIEGSLSDDDQGVYECEYGLPRPSKQILNTKGVLSDDTRLAISYKTDSLATRMIVSATGKVDLLAEVGEQLAWIGAACRQSFQDTISYCTPHLTSTTTANNFHVSYSQETTQLEKSNGACWHSLFRNPVIVTGYPIPFRPEEAKGLDIPVNMMAGLIEATYATEFNGGIVIKGMSSMLIPTKKVQNSVLWHFVRKENGTCIPFFEADEYNRCSAMLGPENVDMSCLNSCRNFVGWTRSSILKAGGSSLR